MNSIIERVNTVCQSVRSTNSEPISFKKLVGQLRKTFKDHDLDLMIKTKKDKTLETGGFYVMAYYDPEDDFNHDTPIEVIAYHNFPDTDYFSKVQITEFLIQIFDAVVHEFRHRHQSIKREYITYSAHESSPYKEYLSDPDEVDAYALSIAIELLRHIDPYRAKKNLTRISIMSKMRRGTEFVSPNLRAYIDHFGLSDLTKRIAKKVYKHLGTLDKQHIFM